MVGSDVGLIGGAGVGSMGGAGVGATSSTRSLVRKLDCVLNAP